MFGIEDFCGKLNGNWPVHELLHPNIAAESAARLPRFGPPSDDDTSLFTRRLLRYIKRRHADSGCDSANYSPGLALTGPGRPFSAARRAGAALLSRFRA
jgi:hypothetical protein